jgi:CRISPR-associated protein Cas1
MHRILELGTPGTRLSVANNQLVVDRPDMGRATIPIEDLASVIVHDRRATYTHAVFVAVLAAGANIVLCGDDHLPIAVVLPFCGHHAQTARHHAQIGVSLPTRKKLWQHLVKSKIRQQAAVLLYFEGHDAGLRPLGARVKTGDPDNIEAQAARRYWPVLFGADFRRDRAEDGINALLNYGYAIVRATVARAVVAAGLMTSFGVHHHRHDNPFCLVDDLFEPYRPYVDWHIRRFVESTAAGCSLSLDDRGVRAEILSLLSATLKIGDATHQLAEAVQISAASLCDVFLGKEKPGSLTVPDGVPVGEIIPTEQPPR